MVVKHRLVVNKINFTFFSHRPLVDEMNGIIGFINTRQTVQMKKHYYWMEKYCEKVLHSVADSIYLLQCWICQCYKVYWILLSLVYRSFLHIHSGHMWNVIYQRTSVYPFIICRKYICWQLAKPQIELENVACSCSNVVENLVKL